MPSPQSHNYPNSSHVQARYAHANRGMFQVLWRAIITNTERFPLFRKPPEGHHKLGEICVTLLKVFPKCLHKSSRIWFGHSCGKKPKANLKTCFRLVNYLSPPTLNSKHPVSPPLSCPPPLFIAVWVGKGERKDSAWETISSGHFSEVQLILTLPAFNLEDLHWMKPMSCLASVRTEA